jgi:hypothetical protein
LKLVRVSPGWYETADGRYAVIRNAAGWKAATVTQDGVWWSEAFRTKREAVSTVARRLTHDRTNA